MFLCFLLFAMPLSPKKLCFVSLKAMMHRIVFLVASGLGILLLICLCSVVKGIYFRVGICISRTASMRFGCLEMLKANIFRF